MTASSPLRRFAAVSLVVLPLLAGCAKPETDFEAIFIDEADGLSEQTHKAIIAAQDAVKANPDDVVRTFTLANLYLQAVRETADTDYYLRVEDLLDDAEARDANNPEIPFQRGLVALGRHDFATALRHGERVTASHPEVPRYYGLLGDAQIELGLYEEAEKTLQTMVDLRPDASSFTRIAYMREIFGDRDGAIEVMQDAVAAGIPNAEQSAWTHAELGRLILPRDLDAAEGFYKEALAVYPDHPASLAGTARIAMARGKQPDAQAIMEKTLKLLPLPEYAALLADIYAAGGNGEKAKAYLSVADLGFDAIAAGGTNVDLERAAFMAEHAIRPPDALAIARRVVKERPTIYAADTLAWALHRAGEHAEAWEQSRQAMRTGTDDPKILFHAGLIAEAAGKKDDARRLLKRVRDASPHFSFALRSDLDAALARLP
jgi:tetratricopeptide (TPR) repeat protein